MIHQYHAQRFRRTGPRGTPVGTVPVGAIVYLQDGVRPFGVSRHFTPVLRNPWRVEAWLNRQYHPCVPGRRVTYMAGGHLAVVRSLRDGRVQTVADWLLLRSIDMGLEAA